MIGRLFGRHLRERLDAMRARLLDIEGQARVLRARVEVLRDERETLRRNLKSMTNAHAETCRIVHSERDRATAAEARAVRMEQIARALYDAAREADHGCGRDLARPCRLCAAVDMGARHLGERAQAPHHLIPAVAEEHHPDDPIVTVRRMIEWRGPRWRVEATLARSLPIGPTVWNKLRILVAPLD